MSKPCRSIILSLIMTSFLATGVRASDCERGWALLDAGENAAADSFFTGLLEDGAGGPAAAWGLVEAWRRNCVFLERMEAARWPEDGGLAAFRRAMLARFDGRVAEGLTAYRAAAASAAAGGDTAGLAAICLEGADCALQGGRPGAAQEMARQALAAARDRRGREEALIRLAGAHNVAGRYDRADSLYAAVENRARAAGRRTTLADALNGRGAVASRLRRPDLSRGYYEEALSLVRSIGDAPRQLRILLNLSYDHTQARDAGAARVMLEEAAALMESCDLQSMGGHIHAGLGAVDETDGNRDGAIAHFRDAYAAFVKNRNRQGELAARQRLAYNLMVAGHYTEADGHYTACLEIIDETGARQILNWVLAGLALSNHRLGHLDRAEDYYLRAIEVNREVGDHMSVAFCRHALGMLDVLRGDFRAALVHNHASLDLAHQIGDMESVGDARVALGDIHFRLGDWDRALAEFQLAETVAREHDLEELLRQAVSGLAAVNTAAGRPDRARAHLEQALDLARRWQDRTATIWALTELAEMDLNAGDTGSAARFLDEADTRLAPRGHYLLRSRTRRLQARLATDPVRSVDLAWEALAAAQAGGLPEEEWACLSELGDVHLAAGDTVGALAAQEQAIQVVESLRRNVGSDELQHHLLRSALGPYERVVDLQATTGGPDGALLAFACAERSRAQVLACRLRAARAGQEYGQAGAEGREILAAIAFEQQRLQGTDLPDTARATARARVSELETAYLLLRLDTAGQDSGPATFAVRHPEPQELVGMLQPGEDVVSYFLGRERSWLFHLSGGRVRAHPLPPREEIETRVRRFLALRESPSSTGDQIRSAGRGLHQLLVAPVLGAGDPPPVLIIVPDGLLHRLPFAALEGADGPLARDCDLFTTPSLQVLDQLRRREAERRETRTEPVVPVIAVGCGGPGEGTRLHPYEGRPFSPLQHADAEARAVAAHFSDAIVLVGPEATEAALAATPLDRAAVLHLAAHSDADARDTRRSFVVLGRPHGGDGGDGLLQWNEAAALDLGASVVTLASCRSARGVLAVGEGVTGLTQAFLFAGGTCVLAAQTDVGDVFTRRFMDGFYDHLRRGETAAGALRRARLEAMTWETGVGGRWADFILVGDGGVRLPESVVARSGPGGRSLALLAAAVAAVVILVVWTRRRT
ncbi:MAG: CHAT domain-containing protein [bacterium]|nr:CHAT domain-containing protein [bacterium]